LIHNPQAVEALQAKGVEVATSLAEVDEGTLVIRSHGVAPSIIDEAADKGLDVVDATCPHVSKAHQAARMLKDEGYAIVIVGEADHPEVEGIMAHADGEAIVVESASTLPASLPSGRVGVVVQTTQSLSRLTEVVEALLPRTRELRVINTICSATGKRQQSAQELAESVDVIIVVGGRNSGNTARLVEICRDVNPRVFHVETAEELQPDWFEGAHVVGVTAGASTPDEQIQGVIRAIESLD
jgi:4-hydroxy-3-methylbut-2-enyl diphosphate reductase